MKKGIICGKPVLHGQIIDGKVVCKECAEAATKHDGKEKEHENQN